LTELFYSRIQQDYSYDSVSICRTSSNGSVDKGFVEENKDELEFRLFAAPVSAASQNQVPIQRVRLRSPSVENQAAGFIIPGRGSGYYFTGDINGARQAELNAVAAEGEDILQQAQSSWPGCALPWRVTTITPAGLMLGVSVSDIDSTFNLHVQRTRPGKRRRIALRKQAQKLKEKKEQAERTLQEKIEAEKGKRTRRNREKKVKRKAREKAKKAGLDAGDNLNDEANVVFLE
jgi:Fungal protein of unknown function (DUF2011)